MKKAICRILAIILCFIMMISSAVLLRASSWNETDASNASGYPYEKYVYPITPTKNPEEWKKLSSHIEMLEVCEIPKTILERLSTKQLLLTCLDYPLAGDMIFYQDAQTGFEIVKDRFNGLCELYQRKDFSQTLSDYYSSFDVAIMASKDCETYFRNVFLKTMTVYAVQENKLADEDIRSIANSCNLIASEMPDSDATHKVYENLYCELNKVYNEKIKEKSAEYDGSWRPIDTRYNFYNTSVLTPRGSAVQGFNFVSDLVSNDYNYYVNYVAVNYPNATILRNPTIYYNCHSYAWHSTDSSNHVWIDNPIAYMTDGSYYHVGTYIHGGSYPSGAVRGCKVFYNNPSWSTKGDHSAIIYSSTLYTSKWGAGCLVRHAQAYCPYFDEYTQLEFYERNYS